MNRKVQTRGNPIKARWLAAVAGAALSLAPVYAHAQNAPSLNKALAGYSPIYSPVYPPGAPFASWLDMVSWAFADDFADDSHAATDKGSLIG
jgi:hypothetical protein